MTHQPWQNATVSGGVSEPIADPATVSRLEREMLALGAFLDGFAEELANTPEGVAAAEREGVQLGRWR